MYETVELFNITKLSRLGKSIMYPTCANAEVATEIISCDDLFKTLRYEYQAASIRSQKIA